MGVIDDFLFYSILVSILAGVLIAATRKMPGCTGSCGQGREKCNCEGDK